MVKFKNSFISSIILISIFTNSTKGDGEFSFDEFVQLMFNMGNLEEISPEQEEKDLKEAFKVTHLIIFLFCS